MLPGSMLGLCAGSTKAQFVTTTEVYPDSPRASPEQCNDAQVAAVVAALDFAIAERDPMYDTHGGLGPPASTVSTRRRAHRR